MYYTTEEENNCLNKGILSYMCLLLDLTIFIRLSKYMNSTNTVLSRVSLWLFFLTQCILLYGPLLIFMYFKMHPKLLHSLVLYILFPLLVRRKWVLWCRAICHTYVICCSFLGVNVNVHVYSPDIPMSSVDCTLIPLVLEHSHTFWLNSHVIRWTSQNTSHPDHVCDNYICEIDKRTQERHLRWTRRACTHN